MNKTNIEYLDFTWNPIVMRCTPVSDGCVKCWHLKRADMLAKNPKIDPWHRSNYAGLPNQAGEIVSLKDLDAPLRRKKPARIGVQLMGDLFHENISFNVIDTVFSVFNLCPHHTFVVLTKRPERMLEWYNQADI